MPATAVRSELACGDPNDLAATLIVGIALVLTRIKNAKGMRQAGYVVMLLTMLFTTAPYFSCVCETRIR